MQAVLLPARRRLLPVFTLAFLAPVIAEFLFGSTHFSTLYLLIVQMGGYGGAAVLIREFVRRQGKGRLMLALTIRKTSRLAPWPWLVGVSAFLLSAPWFVLILFHVGIFPTVPVVIPFIAGVIWSLASLALIWYWSTCRNWQERHPGSCC